MFVCISVNPAIDKRVRLAKLLPGHVNRVTGVQAAAGGKAAHVAMVLRSLGAEPRWIGFVGGSSGQELLAGLRDLRIQAVPVPMKNATRNNLEIIDECGTITEILEPGASVSPEEIRAFESASEKVFSEGGSGVTAILSGSLPPGAPQDLYARLIERAHGFGGKAFLDTSGEPLKLALEAAPDFVKPNREEAEWLTGKPIRDPNSAAAAISQIIVAGAKSAAISLGQDGLVWKPLSDEKFYYAYPAKVAACSAVGSGDAALAGFAYAAQKRLGTEESLKLAAACGAANCLAGLPGQLSTSEVQRLRELVKVEVVAP
jgi:1-phosphofructokinase family hexose kinase